MPKFRVVVSDTLAVYRRWYAEVEAEDADIAAPMAIAAADARRSMPDREDDMEMSALDVIDIEEIKEG